MTFPFNLQVLYAGIHKADHPVWQPNGRISKEKRGPATRTQKLQQAVSISLPSSLLSSTPFQVRGLDGVRDTTTSTWPKNPTRSQRRPSSRRSSTRSSACTRPTSGCSGGTSSVLTRSAKKKKSPFACPGPPQSPPPSLPLSPY